MKRRCGLNIEFDQQDRKYQAGDQVTGRIIIHALQDFSIKAVHIRLSWQAKGPHGASVLYDALVSAKEASSESIKLELTQLDFKEAERYEIPFAFKAPVGPLSYKGENIAIQWSLHAHLDLPKLPGFAEPKTSLDLKISAKEGQDIYLGPSYKKPPKVDDFLMGGNYISPILTVLITAGILWFLTSGSDPFQSRADVIFFWVVIGIAALITLTQILNFFMEQELAQKLKKLDFKLDTQRLIPGEALSYQFLIEPKVETKIKKLSLHFEGKEHTKNDVGNEKFEERKYFEETIHEQKLELLEMRTVAANEAFEKKGKIILPKALPYSFLAKRGDDEIMIRYELKLHFELDNGTSTSRTYQIDVVPWRDKEFSEASKK